MKCFETKQKAEMSHLAEQKMSHLGQDPSDYDFSKPKLNQLISRGNNDSKTYHELVAYFLKLDPFLGSAKQMRYSPWYSSHSRFRTKASNCHDVGLCSTCRLAGHRWALSLSIPGWSMSSWELHTVAFLRDCNCAIF